MKLSMLIAILIYIFALMSMVHFIAFMFTQDATYRMAVTGVALSAINMFFILILMLKSEEK